MFVFCRHIHCHLNFSECAAHICSRCCPQLDRLWEFWSSEMWHCPLGMFFLMFQRKVLSTSSGGAWGPYISYPLVKHHIPEDQNQWLQTCESLKISTCIVVRSSSYISDIQFCGIWCVVTRLSVDDVWRHIVVSSSTVKMCKKNILAFYETTILSWCL